MDYVAQDYSDVLPLLLWTGPRVLIDCGQVMSPTGLSQADGCARCRCPVGCLSTTGMTLDRTVATIVRTQSTRTI